MPEKLLLLLLLLLLLTEYTVVLTTVHHNEEEGIGVGDCDQKRLSRRGEMFGFGGVSRELNAKDVTRTEVIRPLYAAAPRSSTN